MVTSASSGGLVAHRFRLGELLGTGGTASVFAAVDTRDGSSVALKILHPHLAADAEARTALSDEARAAAGLRHQNIVAVLDVGAPDDPLAWIAFELVLGVSLAEYVELNGPLAAPQALAVAQGALRALAAAHAAGIVHRDVSPSNVMVSPRGDTRIGVDDVRLVDFGLADAAGRSAAASDGAGVMGTANFLSPEQAGGGAIDERGDIYQVGAVLYFALTGRPPFPRATAAEAMRAHVSSPPPVPSVLQPRISRGIDRVVVKAMLKQPDERYQSASEMLIAVEALAPETGALDSRTLLLASARPAPPRVRRADHPRAVASAVAEAVPEAPPVAALDEPPTDGSSGWKVVLAAIVVACLAAWVLSATSTTPARTPVDVATVPSAPAVTAPASPVVEQVQATPLAEVPDLAGRTIVDAGVALDTVGLLRGAIVEEPSAFAVGTVLRSEPAPASRLAPGTTVDLVVASGTNAVPAVEGLSRDAAIAAIQNAGFGVQLAVVTDPSRPRGTVLGSEPADASVVLLGRSVTILVATSGAATPSPTPTPTGAPDDSGE